MKHQPGRPRNNPGDYYLLYVIGLIQSGKGPITANLEFRGFTTF